MASAIGSVFHTLAHGTWQLVKKKMVKKSTIVLVFWVLPLISDFATAQDLAQEIAVLRTVQAGDEGTRLALPAIARLKSGTIADLIPVLNAMKDAAPIGRNYLALAANSLHRKGSAALTSQLEEFVEDRSQDGEARYMVFQWLTANDQQVRATKLALMIDDPSLELRFAAIELATKQVEGLENQVDRAAKLSELFHSSRQPMQVIRLAKKLTDLAKPVDTIKHFGFLTQWNLIGPFDNANELHFDTVYDVEKDLLANKFDTSSSYPGKHDKVSWLQHTSDNQEGVVNVADLYIKEKGAIVYAVKILTFKEAQRVELRLGTINANKVWWNSELVTANKVYHSAMEIDQYVGPIEVRSGANQVVLKLCQNEQTQPWAQDWKFQVRICKPDGTAVLPQ